MKKLVLIGIFAFLSTNIFAQLRPVKGIYLLVTKDSIQLGGTTLYPDNSSNQRKPLFITIDSISRFDNKKLLWDQTGGWCIYFKIYQCYFAYRHWAADLPYSTYSILIPYDDFDVQGSGTGLEGYLPPKIKTAIATLFGVAENKVQLGSLNDN